MAAGSKQHAFGGFTLLELLVVLSIIAVAVGGVTLAMRDTSDTYLQRDAERLAVLLESARAQSRMSGIPVVWHVQDDGFRFDGLAAQALPHNWLNDGTRDSQAQPVTLGPEPIIARQEVILSSALSPQRSWRVWTDGLRPFAAQPYVAEP